MKTLASLLIGALFAATANAASVSANATPPVVDGQDIASFGTPTGQDKWWPGSATAYGNPGKTVGQTFTVGNEDVILNAFTFQIRDAVEPTKEFIIRVGTVSDTTFTEIASETATLSDPWDADSYVTWTLDSPVTLSANTVYGVDVGLTSSTSEWQTGIPYVYYTADVYDGGTRFRSGSEGYGIGNDTMDHMSGDRVFHIDLSSAATQAGDFNLDAQVEQTDLNLLLANWGASTVPPEWTAPFDGLVDQNELNDLLANWGAGLGGAEAVGATETVAPLVPEPATLGLLLLGGLLTSRRRLG